MQIKTTMRYHLTPDKMAITRKTEITSVGEDVEKRESLCPVGGNVNWYSHYGNQYGGYSKIKNRNTRQSSNSTSTYLFEENKNTNLKRYKYPNVH